MRLRPSKELVSNLALCPDRLLPIAPGIFLFNNVKQALNIINKRPQLLQEMRQLGVQSTKEFYSWLEEERAYLLSLKKEPAEEMLKMEYVKALGKLEELE